MSKAPIIWAQEYATPQKMLFPVNKLWVVVSFQAIIKNENPKADTDIKSTNKNGLMSLTIWFIIETKTAVDEKILKK